MTFNSCAKDNDLSRAMFLFHTPPYNTGLDRAALDGKKVNYVDLDVHVGSIAVRRFIESRQPLLTLHGHIHESARITGSGKNESEGPSPFRRRMTVLNWRSSGSIWMTWKAPPGN